MPSVEYSFFGKTYEGSYSVDGDVVTVTSEIGSRSHTLDGNRAEGWAQILMAEIVGAAFRDHRL